MILRLILGVVVLYLLYRIVKGWKRALATRGGEPKRGEDLVEDPYCHTYIPVSDAIKVVIRGNTYFFCSKACQDRYIEGTKR